MLNKNQKPIAGIKQLLRHAERFASMLPTGMEAFIDSASIHLERSNQAGITRREVGELAAFQSYVATRLEDKFGNDERIGFVLNASNEGGGIWVSQVELTLNEAEALANGFSLDDIDLADALLNQVCEQIASSLNDEVVKEAEPLFDLNRQCLKPGKGLPINDRMQEYLTDIGLLALCDKDDKGAWIMSQVIALSDYFDTNLTEEMKTGLLEVRTSNDLKETVNEHQLRLQQAYTSPRSLTPSLP